MINLCMFFLSPDSWFCAILEREKIGGVQKFAEYINGNGRKIENLWSVKAAIREAEGNGSQPGFFMPVAR